MQPAIGIFQLIGMDDLASITAIAEELLKLFKLTLRGQAAQVDDRDIRFLSARAAPFFISAQQRIEQMLARIERGDFETLGKPFHHRQLHKDARHYFAIRDAGGTLAVQFNKLIAALGEKRIESRSHRYAGKTGVDRDQFALLLGN